MFLLIISTFSFLLFLYAVLWSHKWDYLHAIIDVLFYIIFYIINTLREEALDSFTPRSYLRYKKCLDLNLPLIPLFVATLLTLIERNHAI